MQRLRTWRYWSWLRDGAIALLLLLLLFALRAYQQRDLVRGAAPGLAGRTLDGAQVSLADYRGAPVLLRFPTTLVIDANGEIRYVEVGYSTELGLRARMWLAGL